MPKGQYMRNPAPRDWKPDHDQRLGELLELGLSFAQVRNAMNDEFPGNNWSRNACLGRAKRAGFQSKHKHGGADRKGKKRAKKADRTTKVKRQPKVIEAPVVFMGEGDGIMLREEGAITRHGSWRKRSAQEIEANKAGHLPSIIEIAPLTSVLLSDCPDNGCKWPTNDEPFMVCGSPAVLGSYCSRHGNVAFRELPTAKRNRAYSKRGQLDTRRERIVNAQQIADDLLDDEVRVIGDAPLMIPDFLKSLD
jgi:hypothetical protein